MEMRDSENGTDEVAILTVIFVKAVGNSFTDISRSYPSHAGGYNPKLAPWQCLGSCLSSVTQDQFGLKNVVLCVSRSHPSSPSAMSVLSSSSGPLSSQCCTDDASSIEQLTQGENSSKVDLGPTILYGLPSLHHMYSQAMLAYTILASTDFSSDALPETVAPQNLYSGLLPLGEAINIQDAAVSKPMNEETPMKFVMYEPQSDNREAKKKGNSPNLSGDASIRRRQRSKRAARASENTPAFHVKHDSSDGPASPGLRCPQCQKTFTRSKSLHAHLRTHINERPHACTICTRTFSRRHDLNRHVRVHTREKPYECPECQRSFSRSDALRRHWRQEEACGKFAETRAVKRKKRGSF
ncbi:uncharacterized protein VTP21DRAFT_11517 [Calcarisporiella thermophila]|uniref:uncharacterized protein n=1 Tax=Calcarisporiella thermophila TaxID=911321 RepID=UPI0037423D59